MRKAFVAVAVIACLFFVARIRAFNPQPDPPGFGTISIVPGETMRLYSYCVALPINGFPPDPCSVQLTFHSVTGAVISTVTGNLQPGATGHLDLLSTQIKFGTGVNHLGIHPEVAIESGHVIPSVETFDTASGASHMNAVAAVPRLSLIVAP